MKAESIRPMIVVFVVLTLLFALSVPPGHSPYRLKERIDAIKAYAMNPSASNKAAVDDEEAQLQHNEMIYGFTFLLLPVLLVNAAVIYSFWNYGKRERTG